MISENLIHRPRRGAEKMRPADIARSRAGETDKCFMHQSRGLQGVVDPLFGELPSGHSAQFRIQDAEEPGKGSGI